MEPYVVSEELSREADARCCAALVAVIEHYVPLMRPDEARPYLQALPRLRQQAGLDRDPLLDG